MKYILFSLFMIIRLSIHAHSIVYVYLGNNPPPYLLVSIAQARLFNKECPIYLIANQNVLDQWSASMQKDRVTTVSCESIRKTEDHNHFIQCSTLDRGGSGFWFYTSERFFYLEGCIKKYNLIDVFHLENDMMIYVDLEALLPTFYQHYKNKIGTTFEQDYRCVPGFLYIPNAAPLEQMTHYFAKFAHDGIDDMTLIGRFCRDCQHQWIDYLPVIPTEYVLKNELRTITHTPTSMPGSYSKYVDEFSSIFDAAAMGQFLGGIDPTYHVDHHPGFVNPNCLFQAYHFMFVWEKDEEGRKIPFAVYEGKKYRLNNLHVHCKRLNDFYSGQ